MTDTPSGANGPETCPVQGVHVVCDERNNSSADIAQNRLNVTVLFRAPHLPQGAATCPFGCDAAWPHYPEQCEYSLSDAEFDHVVDMSENPVEPTPTMKEVWERYNRLLNQRATGRKPG